MSASSHLHRSMARLAVDNHRQMQRRQRAADFYAMGEREQQFQYALSGIVGVQPVETLIKVRFDIMFLYEYGTRRDSQLLEPIVRFGFSKLSAPPGTVPYAHVQSWVQNADMNYMGAKVVAGIHNPSLAVMGTTSPSTVDFTATLHCTFQGYGVPIDRDVGTGET